MKKGEKTTSSDWRKRTMLRIRKLIKQANARIEEEIKYKIPSNPAGIPVWHKDGMICTGKSYKNHLRLTFAKGSAHKQHDSQELFNRYSAIIIQEDDKITNQPLKTSSVRQ